MSKKFHCPYCDNTTTIMTDTRMIPDIEDLHGPKKKVMVTIYVGHRQGEGINPNTRLGHNRCPGSGKTFNEIKALKIKRDLKNRQPEPTPKKELDAQPK